MADISDAERAFIAEGIAQGERPDGRGCTDYRSLQFELGVISQAHGSARLHMGGTDVIVGVKVELSLPDVSEPTCGRLGVTVECSACASPEFRGRGGEDWGIELAKALEASLLGRPGLSGSGFDLRTLCIVPGKVCWHLFVDALVLNDGGGALGALSLATRAALAGTRIPRVTVEMGEAEEDGEPEVELGADELALEWQGAPVVVSVGQVGSHTVVDMSAEEERCTSAVLHVAVSPSGVICGVTKDGSRGIQPSLLQEMLEMAQRLGPRLTSSLDGYVTAAAVES